MFGVKYEEHIFILSETCVLTVVSVRTIREVGQDFENYFLQKGVERR